MSEVEVTSTEFEDEGKPEEQKPPADPTNTPAQNGSKLNSNFYERTRTTIYMILAFIIVLTAGQLYSAIAVQLLNLLIFVELNSIKRNEEKEVKIPLTKYINWYLFLAFNYFALGKFVAGKLPYLGVKYPLVGQLLLYHNFVCFALFVVGFLSFVLSLRQGFLKYQFRLFAWIIIAILLVCTPAWSICSNIYEGIIWFIMPSLLIVINDIFAYLFGYFLGKHQLIALSPKKTWEGYIGGAISTCLFSIIVLPPPRSSPRPSRASTASPVPALPSPSSPSPSPTAPPPSSASSSSARSPSPTSRRTSCCSRSSPASSAPSAGSSPLDSSGPSRSR